MGRSAAIAPQLDGEGEFGEGRRQPIFRVGIRAEFVVAAAHVLNKSVSGANHSGRTQLFEAAHRPQPSLELKLNDLELILARRCVICLDRRLGASLRQEVRVAEPSLRRCLGTHQPASPPSQSNLAIIPATTPPDQVDGAAACSQHKPAVVVFQRHIATTASTAPAGVAPIALAAAPWCERVTAGQRYCHVHLITASRQLDVAVLGRLRHTSP